MSRFAEAIMSSIIEAGAVPFQDKWSIFAYLGDTKYHVHLFYDGEARETITRTELGDICDATERWFNKEAMTTLPCPVNPG